MTNTWQDIKNANVVLVMGGNAAEAHPCGFKWVIEAKIENGAKLVVIDPRFTRTASVADVYAPIRPGTDIAFLSGVIRYLHRKGPDSARVRARLHQRQPHRERWLRLRGRALHRIRRREARIRQVELGLREGRPGLRQGRRHVAEPALRHQPVTQARRPLHARDGVAHLRHAAGQVPADLRLVRFVLCARQSADQPVRARLDAAFGRGAEHPHDGDGAAAARQHRRGGRRHERAARPFQHPGLDRRRAPVERDARLSHFAARH